MKVPEPSCLTRGRTTRKQHPLLAASTAYGACPALPEKACGQCYKSSLFRRVQKNPVLCFSELYAKPITSENAVAGGKTLLRISYLFFDFLGKSRSSVSRKPFAVAASEIIKKNPKDSCDSENFLLFSQLEGSISFVVMPRFCLIRRVCAFKRLKNWIVPSHD